MTIKYRRSRNHRPCWRSNIVSFMTPSAPYEKSMFVGSGQSVVARLELEGFNGKAPPRVEPAALCAPTLEKPTRSRHSKD